MLLVDDGISNTETAFCPTSTAPFSFTEYDFALTCACISSVVLDSPSAIELFW